MRRNQYGNKWQLRIFDFPRIFRFARSQRNVKPRALTSHAPLEVFVLEFDLSLSAPSRHFRFGNSFLLNNEFSPRESIKKERRKKKQEFHKKRNSHGLNFNTGDHLFRYPVDLKRVEPSSETGNQISFTSPPPHYTPEILMLVESSRKTRASRELQFEFFRLRLSV